MDGTIAPRFLTYSVRLKPGSVSDLVDNNTHHDAPAVLRL